MQRSSNNPWLHRFAVFAALATLALIGIGGLVTSHGAGMSVPDWPTTYGYNMFLFPISLWKGGIFYEHTHRLWASFVGLLTIVLAVWLWLAEERKWLRRLGVVAFFAVAFQGLLGGLRVTMYKDEIGIFHALLAQMFFVLLTVIALVTSKWWRENSAKLEAASPDRAWGLCFAVCGLILLQLALGATMRHQHAGLAVPDFPLAYGKIWPATDAASVDAINRARTDVLDPNPITSFHIIVHMVHRLVAFVILAAVLTAGWRVRRQARPASLPARLALAWMALICLQLLLGIVTVLKNKPADMATLHVVCGALSLVTGSLLTVVLYRFGWMTAAVKSVSSAGAGQVTGELRVGTAA